MVDLSKEIKLSDLLSKRPSSKSRAKKAEAAKRKPMPADIVGLKIEAGSLTAAHVVNNGGKSLVRLAHSQLEPGIVNGGEVRDPAGLATALNELFSDNSLPRNCVRLGIANTRIGVRTIEIAGAADGEQLENAVNFRAHELLSTPLNEAVLDYQVLETSTDEEGQPVHKVLLVIALRDSVDRQLAATDAANLQVTGIDLDAFALLRASVPVRTEGAGTETSVIAVAIDHDLTTLAISDGSTCHFTRVLEWGDGNIDNALARSLKLTPEQVAELRAELTLEPTADSAGFGQPGALQPADVVRREMQTLARELLSSIRFYGSQQPGAAPVTSVVVSGSTVDLPGFLGRLGSDLAMPVSAADPFSRVELAPDFIYPQQSAGLVVAVGLGIED
jgi:type IV pilus assembly protein PilM